MRLFLLITFFFFTCFCQGQAISLQKLQLVAPKPSYCSSVKDQFMSSTCWSFASNALLESELLRNGKDIDLSEMYVARYSYLRKIQLHLKLKGQNFFTPGGQFHDVAWVIKNHGIVPESAYPGKVNGATRHDHSELDTLIAHFIKDMVQKGVDVMNAQQELYVKRLLDNYLGPVPASFIYNGTQYTPMNFLRMVLEFNPDDYVEITSYTHHPFYKPFVLEDKYNWTGDAYYNVTMDDFTRITDNALLNGYTVGWDGDSDDPYFNYYSGLAYLPDTIMNFQSARQKAFEDQSTLLTHMMQLVSITKDKYGRVWYYIKNSWGDYSNSLGGFMFMRDDYYKIRTVALIVNKNAIPADIRVKLGI